MVIYDRIWGAFDAILSAKRATESGVSAGVTSTPLSDTCSAAWPPLSRRFQFEGQEQERVAASTFYAASMLWVDPRLAEIADRISCFLLLCGHNPDLDQKIRVRQPRLDRGACGRPVAGTHASIRH